MREYNRNKTIVLLTKNLFIDFVLNTINASKTIPVTNVISRGGEYPYLSNNSFMEALKINTE